jgi:hypothetical protein
MFTPPLLVSTIRTIVAFAVQPGPCANAGTANAIRIAALAPAVRAADLFFMFIAPVEENGTKPLLQKDNALLTS